MSVSVSYLKLYGHCDFECDCEWHWQSKRAPTSGNQEKWQPDQLLLFWNTLPQDRAPARPPLPPSPTTTAASWWIIPDWVERQPHQSCCHTESLALTLVTVTLWQLHLWPPSSLTQFDFVFDLSPSWGQSSEMPLIKFKATTYSNTFSLVPTFKISVRFACNILSKVWLLRGLPLGQSGLSFRSILRPEKNTVHKL